MILIQLIRKKYKNQNVPAHAMKIWKY